MASPILEARELHSYYGSSHVLQGVDFSIGAGEVVALMGRNGMGKTTLLRSMLGLLKPRAGVVKIDGAPVTELPPHRIARLGIAFVPENRGIFPTLTVAENLLMAARPAATAVNAWTLERVLAVFPPLAARLGHRGGQLSGGEQQMLTIGRALLTNPRLLILDEATEGLAPRVAATIWRTIRSIRDGGIATVIVDKHFAMLAEIADRCAILVKGRKVFDGSPAELAAQPGLREQHLGI
jgi:branched-chain amino acid transport system ATP-binding protein